MAHKNSKYIGTQSGLLKKSLTQPYWFCGIYKVCITQGTYIPRNMVLFFFFFKKKETSCLQLL